MNRIVLALLAALLLAAPVRAQPVRPEAAPVSDDDVITAYHYMLGRWLILRQETLDLKGGMRWNHLVHREPGGVAWANPNLDAAYSEAWIGIDETSCTLVTLPEITKRYYTVQVVNGWGEVTANINERTFPQHPFGTFGLCVKGATVTLPAGTERIDLPNRKSRVLIRIELGADPAEARALQQKITMQATGTPTVAETVVAMRFANDKLPGSAGFDHTEAILASDPDINPGMAEPANAARAVGALAGDKHWRIRLDRVIRTQAIPKFHAALGAPGPVENGWIHPRVFGNYGTDYLTRSVVNLLSIWANNATEVVYFGRAGLDGNRTYTQTFPKTALPDTKARYFWSVVAVDGARYRVLPNPLDRHVLGKTSGLRPNADGSLTLAFGPNAPAGVPESNWLPTVAGKPYNLTYRFYGPTEDVTKGTYYPPALTAGGAVPDSAAAPADSHTDTASAER